MAGAVACATACTVAAAVATVAACGGAAERAPIDPGPTALSVSPAAVTCAVGERVRLTAAGAASGSYEFVASDEGGVVRVVAAPGGEATVACAAVGDAAVVVAAGGARASVPVTVRPTPGAVLGLDVAPTSIGLVTAATWRLAARARTRDTSVSAAVRYASLDTSVVEVDAAGVVRAVAPGEAAVVVSAAADPEVRATVDVTVGRGSALVESIFITPFGVALTVGDTVRLLGVVALTRTAPPGTSRAAVFSTADTATIHVSETGLVRARRAGIATVQGTAVAAPALRTTARVIVRVPAPTRD